MCTLVAQRAVDVTALVDGGVSAVGDGYKTPDEEMAERVATMFGAGPALFAKQMQEMLSSGSTAGSGGFVFSPAEMRQLLADAEHEREELEKLSFTASRAAATIEPLMQDDASIAHAERAKEHVGEAWLAAATEQYEYAAGLAEAIRTAIEGTEADDQAGADSFKNQGA
ncbi:MAG: hypothetical protein ACRDQB_06550 [Thermocrispum sp.]